MTGVQTCALPIYNSQIFIETTRLLWNLASVPYYDFSVEISSTDNFIIDCLQDLIIPNDLARDQFHFGYQSHQAIGKKVCDKL